MNKKILALLSFAMLCVMQQPVYAKITEGKWHSEWKSVKKTYKKKFKNQAFSKGTKKHEELVNTLLKSLDKAFKKQNVKRLESQLDKYKDAGKNFIKSIEDDIKDAENDDNKKTLKDVHSFFETALKAITTSVIVSVNKLKGPEGASSILAHMFDDVKRELSELELSNAKWIAAAKKGANGKRIAALIKKEKKNLMEIRKSLVDLDKMGNKLALKPNTELAAIANTINGITSGSIAALKKEDIVPTLEQFEESIKVAKKWLKKAEKAQQEASK